MESAKSPLSADARLIAASNLAVAEAIMHLLYSQKAGSPTTPIETQVLNWTKAAIQKLDELAS